MELLLLALTIAIIWGITQRDKLKQKEHNEKYNDYGQLRKDYNDDGTPKNKD